MPGQFLLHRRDGALEPAIRLSQPGDVDRNVGRPDAERSRGIGQSRTDLPEGLLRTPATHELQPGPPADLFGADHGHEPDLTRAGDVRAAARGTIDPFDVDDPQQPGLLRRPPQTERVGVGRIRVPDNDRQVLAHQPVRLGFGRLDFGRRRLAVEIDR
jgi:hypothetical protein